MKKRLLWVGDAGCDSGFARCTHRTLDYLKEVYDVAVLGINYRGDPHEYPYPIFPALVGGDFLGVRRIKAIVKKWKPDVIVLQNDPWNIPPYLKELVALAQERAMARDEDPRKVTEPDVPVVGTIAVDSMNCRALKFGLNKLKRVLFWTEFGRQEAIKGGLTAPSGVVPLGVDLDIFKPGDRREARKWIGLPDECLDAFIVGNINRNQPRKRLDLTIRYFAEWIKRYQIEDAYLYLHVCPTGDTGIDCNQLSNYYGIPGKLILAEPDVWKGASLEHVARTYQCFDAQINTALGEGFGLTSLEGMAAGVVQIGPDIAAFGPLGWPGDAMIRLPYEETVFSSPTNQIGGVIDREAVIETLQLLYKSGFDRWQMREKGLALANRPEFRWYNIGVAFAEELEKALLDHATNEDAIHAERVQGDASQARTSGVPIS